MTSLESTFFIEVEICVLMPSSCEYDLELFERQAKFITAVCHWPSIYADGRPTPGVRLASAGICKLEGETCKYRIKTQPHTVSSVEYVQTYKEYGDNVAKNFRQILPGNALGAYAQIHRSWGEVQTVAK